jgi:hypothetical protein
MSDDIIIIEGASLTLTLESVPVSMAGVADGALQTAQRIGAAIGTPRCWPRSITRCSPTPATTTRWRHPTRLCATGLMLLALLMAVAELVRRRSPAPDLADVATGARRPAVHCGHHRPGCVGGQDRRPVDHCVEDRSLGLGQEIAAR